MAARTINDKPKRCKTCAAFDRVSLTLEFCGLHKRTVLGEDAGCSDRIDSAPWSNWLLTVPSSAAIKDDREN